MLEIKIFLLNSRLVMFEYMFFSLKLKDFSPKNAWFRKFCCARSRKSGSKVGLKKCTKLYKTTYIKPTNYMRKIVQIQVLLFSLLSTVPISHFRDGYSPDTPNWSALFTLQVSTVYKGQFQLAHLCGRLKRIQS